jgi:16S rRNA (uracil1498-N3)-methyltransferase
MAHFFIDETLETAASSDHVTLSGPEGRHAATVSRLRVGEAVMLGNGRGLTCTAEVVAVDKSAVSFLVREVQVTSQPRHRFVLAQALAKSDRDERAVEAAVEVGVDAIIPFVADRSISRWVGDKVQKGQTRWQSIAREASKQSLRAWVPSVVSPSSALEILARERSNAFVLDQGGQAFDSVDWAHVVMADEATGEPQVGNESVFIVGPEGGFSDAERAHFDSAKTQILRLGEHVLRTSTAGPVALAIASALSGRWR